MEENVVNNDINNIENSNLTTNSDDNMFTMLVRMVFVVILGGLIVKLFRKAVNWFKEGQRLRREEKDRKAQEKVNELIEKEAEKKVQEKLDALLERQVKESEKDSEKKE